MKNFLVFLVVLIVAVGALGYWRGWFNVNTDGKVEVKVDQEKFKLDKEAFNKKVSEQSKALKDQVASLWKKTEGLTGDEKAHAQKELSELKLKHERLEQQIRDLDAAGSDGFEGLKQDLTKNLEEVEKKIAEWTKKLENAKDKSEDDDAVKGYSQSPHCFTAPAPPRGLARGAPSVEMACELCSKVAHLLPVRGRVGDRPSSRRRRRLPADS